MKRLIKSLLGTSSALLPEKKSAVGGIVTKDGKIGRVIVDSLEDMPLHINHDRGERLVIVPDFWVIEPVPFNDIPHVIKTVEIYAKQQGII